MAHSAVVGPRPLVLFGVPIHDVTEEGVIAWLTERTRSRIPSHVVTTNLDFLLQSRLDPEMHRIHLESDLNVPDGMPLLWISRVSGPPLRERVAGSDLVARFAKAARDLGLSVYAVGSGPGVAQRALEKLQEEFPGLRVAGSESPALAPILGMDDEETVKRVRASRPDILFVAFGAPKQEKWIRLHLATLGVPVVIGIGGSLDFIVGVQTRAPRWVQSVGMEWFWRLALQPRRLLKRYYDDFRFLVSMLGQLLALRLSPTGASRRGDVPGPESLRSRGALVVRMEPDGSIPPAEAWSVVLDLSRRVWLDSEDLGRLVSLGRRCRSQGGRLFLVGRAPRVERLLRLFRMERYLELPRSGRDLDSRLEELRDPAGRVAGRTTRLGQELRVRLPEELDRGAVDRLRGEFLKEWSQEEVRELLLDATGTTFIDAAGARFLLGVMKLAGRLPGRSVSLRGVATEDLRRLRREGFDAMGPGRSEESPPVRGAGSPASVGAAPLEKMRVDGGKS